MYLHEYKYKTLNNYKNECNYIKLMKCNYIGRQVDEEKKIRMKQKSG